MNAVDAEISTQWQTDTSLAISEASIDALVMHTLVAEGASGAWSITVVLSTDRHLQALHRDFMGLDSPTDIMTFPYEVEDVPDGSGEDQAGCGGDIFISVERAAANAAEEGWDTASEVEFLICHGVLHLMGWEDGQPAQRHAMLNRQRELLQSFHGVSEHGFRPHV